MKNQILHQIALQGLLTECIAASQDIIDAQNATVFAYTYGYPLYPFGTVVAGASNYSTNTLIHARDLATADKKGVVRPNVDTLYSRSILDLSSADLSITIPEFDNNRYWVWPFYDIYANDVANIGILKSSQAGQYLVRYDPENVGIQTENITEPYLAYINLPTPYGLSVVRILVESSTDDIVAVRELQDQLAITTIPHDPVAPTLNVSLFTDPEYMPGSATTLEEGVLKLTAKLAPYNLPEVQGDIPWVDTLLEQAGIENGTFTKPAGVDLVVASTAANLSAEAKLAESGTVINLGNGWSTNNASSIGDYESNYAARYHIAAVGYLALTPDEVLYPNYYYNIILMKNQALLLSFSAKPPIQDTGFWSLTAYSHDGYLIPNVLGRYALGDRSKLTFSDGTLLSDGGDGPFQILVQASQPPVNWTSNWLPSAVDGGLVLFNLRFYGPEEALTNGSYVFPVGEVVDGITA